MFNYTRAELKAAAKESLSGKWGTAIIALLLGAVLPAVVLSILEGAFGMNDPEGGGSFFGTAIVAAVSILIINPLAFTLSFTYLGMTRNENVSGTSPYGYLFSNDYGRLVLSAFMMNLFIFLWSLLLVIPGIIKSFSYAMLPYLLKDHPEMDWKEGLAESKRMMNGNKGSLFVLYLSFIPWLLLVAVTCGIAVIYVAPYMEATIADFYRALKGEDPKEKTVDFVECGNYTEM